MTINGSPRYAHTAQLNLVLLHRCGKAVGYPTLAPLTEGLVCDGCYPLYDEHGNWLGTASRRSDTAWRALTWDDPELYTAPGVPPLGTRPAP